MPPKLKPIAPKPPRWEPTPDPNDIVIPGLNTTAPVNDQIEQIEQLITLKLQQIDANFSKMQQVMANKILPAVKRYAVGTQPVRDAATFWTTFFEQAAQIRVPTYDDFESMHSEQEQETTTGMETGTEAEESSHSENQEDEDAHQSVHHPFNPDSTGSDTSFMPGHAAVSSTPATMSRHRTFSNLELDADAMPSWSASLDSPLVQLNREIQSLTRDGEMDPLAASALHTSAVSALEDDSQDLTQRQIHLPRLGEQKSLQSVDKKGKGKARETNESMLRGILRPQAPSAEPPSGSRRTATSPLKLKQRTPSLKPYNPYVPPENDPNEWSGVVDLKDRSIATPRRALPSSLAKQASIRAALAKKPPTPKFTSKYADGDDDSFDDINFGLSPLRTVDLTKPRLGKTPKKEAAERVIQDLLDTARKGGLNAVRAASRGQDSGESSLSTMGTPPSFSKYTRSRFNTAPSDTSTSVADASLESMMRRIGLNVPGFGEPSGSGYSASRSMQQGVSSATLDRTIRDTSLAAGSHAEEPQTPDQFQYNLFNLQDDDLQPPDVAEGADDSLDSLDDYDEANNTANPSAAFLLVSQRASSADDSGSDSSDSDSFGAEPVGAVDDTGEPVHPFARGLAEGFAEDDGFDDSFDDPVYGAADAEEETVFGVPPAQRLQAQAAARARASQGGNLRMLGEDLLQDTVGIGAQAGSVETPTPWPGGR
ncbi:hypothetical protein CERSUDRAFT_145767 [Gelatoporia subvermispora B]|uniref:DASH complex subunit ASK1 n=1 Tax=Ceriporiopsis subvermispora (strain B) TaxID=914234 RepID=M2QFS4_CERS8|nr:hypothetical protein CERSUDRAFT_145767 [Gelatoporia subvermispora B]